MTPTIISDTLGKLDNMHIILPPPLPILSHYKNRMSKENFDTILDLVTPMISHPANHIRPISPLQRLAITLRY